MAFPVIADTSIRSDATNTTNHTGTLPNGGMAGDLVIASLGMDGNTTLGWPVGWLVLSPLLNSGGDGSLEVRYRVLDGLEAPYIIVTSVGNEGGTFAMYRITDWHGTTPPEAGFPVSGSSTSPDAPLVSPSWGLDDNLFIFVAGWGNSVSTITGGFPANYVLSPINDLVSTANLPGIGMAGRNLQASSDDPDAATLSVSTNWVANTLVVRPSEETSEIIHPVFATETLDGVMFGGQVVR